MCNPRWRRRLLYNFDGFLKIRSPYNTPLPLVEAPHPQILADSIILSLEINVLRRDYEKMEKKREAMFHREMSRAKKFNEKMMELISDRERIDEVPVQRDEEWRTWAQKEIIA